MKKIFVAAWSKKALIAVLILVFIACNKSNTAVELPPEPIDISGDVCGIKDPANNLPWLKNIINGTNPKMYGGATIYAYMYKGGQVIYVNNPASSFSGLNVYDCNGNILIGNSTGTGSQWSEFWTFIEKEKTSEKLLWRKD